MFENNLKLNEVNIMKMEIDLMKWRNWKGIAKRIESFKREVGIGRY